MRFSVQVGPTLRGRQVRVGELPDGFDLPVKLVFGSKSCAVKSMPSTSSNTPTLYLSQAAMSAFGIPSNVKLFVDGRGTTWRLGPILGLYVDKLPSANRPFGEQTRMFEELTTYGMNMGVFIVVVSPGQIMEKKAWRYDGPSANWSIVQGISPDLVIRRSGSFTKGNARKATIDLQYLKRTGRLHTLPRDSSNKWNLYAVLSQSSLLRDHLPKTSLCTSAGEVYRAVQSRQDVYVKPPGGAQGVSIYRLKRKGSSVIAHWDRRIVPRKTEQYSSVFLTETKPMQRVLASEADFQAFWKRIGLNRVIVQDTVVLPTDQGSRFDFRWLVQSSDSPTVVARIARLGQVGGTTTNIHTGGKAQAAELLIEKAVGKKQSERVVKQMDDIAISMVKLLADRYGQFAELGIDMAVTTRGDIYIFEINPTPGRRMLRMMSPGTRRLSLESLLEYAIRAAGYRA